MEGQNISSTEVKKKRFNNKWIRAAIPALLIHCSIGTVYCWSTFSKEIANHIGLTSGIEWAFSLAIFFLGMSAAFCGSMVEKNIKRSSLLSAIFFAVGMAGTGLFIYLKSFVCPYRQTLQPLMNGCNNPLN